MKLLPAAIALSTAWLLAAPLHATVGDDQNTLFQRYGKGKQVGGNVLLYKIGGEEADGISVTIYFDGNFSSMEVFSRGHDAKGQRIPLSKDDMRLILQQNASGQHWQSYRSKSGKLFWRRTDGKIMAHYDPQEAALTMMAANSQIGKGVLPNRK